jgi:hypothetical protein
MILLASLLIRLTRNRNRNLCILLPRERDSMVIDHRSRLLSVSSRILPFYLLHILSKTMTTLITPANFPEAKRELITAFYAASDRRDVDKVSPLNVISWSTF